VLSTSFAVSQARVIDSEPHALERIDGMRIRRDRELDAGKFRRAADLEQFGALRT
jgi:hypothetical protein